jgi:hypothetical protein
MSSRAVRTEAKLGFAQCHLEASSMPPEEDRMPDQWLHRGDPDKITWQTSLRPSGIIRGSGVLALFICMQHSRAADAPVQDGQRKTAKPHLHSAQSLSESVYDAPASCEINGREPWSQSLSMEPSRTTSLVESCASCPAYFCSGKLGGDLDRQSSRLMTLDGAV